MREMKIVDAPLPGLIIIEPRVFADSRGYFFEDYQQERYTELGMPAFVQHNLSHSKKHVLRGLERFFSSEPIDATTSFSFDNSMSLKIINEWQMQLHTLSLNWCDDLFH